MISLNDYELFRTQKSLKELSIDDSDADNIQYMTNSQLSAVDFDIAKRTYVNSLGLSEEQADSVDALLQTNDSIAFIEFKNGKMNNEKRKVKDKIKDSLLLFSAITGKTISYTRQKADFVLVYNVEKNPLPNQLKKTWYKSRRRERRLQSTFFKRENRSSFGLTWNVSEHCILGKFIHIRKKSLKNIWLGFKNGVPSF